MADISGTNIAAAVVPFTTEDSYSSHDSKYGKGGWREVATTAERDAITTQRRTAGMAVYVTGEDKVYILNDDLTTWAEFETGKIDKIQKNGIDLPIVSKTVNISVPTKISDLTDDTSTNPIDKADTLTGLTATVTELNYVGGVTSSIQTQLDGKLDLSGGTMTGALNMGNHHINDANYVYANWYNIGANIASNSAGTEFLIKQGGWIYSRTAAQVLSDIGAQASLGFTPENVANKTTSVTSSSTDTQYPSAKAVYSYHDSTKADISDLQEYTAQEVETLWGSL